MKILLVLLVLLPLAFSAHVDKRLLDFFPDPDDFRHLCNLLGDDATKATQATCLTECHSKLPFPSGFYCELLCRGIVTGTHKC